MKALFLLGLLSLAFISAEDLYFLSDEQLTDGIELNSMANFTAGANSILDLAERAINIFKSSKTSVIKEKITNRGFEYFKGGCTVQQLNGLLPQFYDRYLDITMDRIGYPTDQRKKVKGLMEDVLFTDKGVAFKTYDLVFNAMSAAKDTTNSLLFVGAYNERGSLDIFISNMNADFKLAPDLTIISKTKSLIGGLWSKSEDVVEKSPANMTTDDIKIIIAFFEYIGLDQFATFMGIRLPKLI